MAGEEMEIEEFVEEEDAANGAVKQVGGRRARPARPLGRLGGGGGFACLPCSRTHSNAHWAHRC